MTSDSAITAKSLRAATAGVELRVLPLSPAMIALERAVENVAATRLPVLILGEAGSGKRELARRIHFLAGGHLEELREIECVNLTAPELVHLTGSRERPGRLEQPAQNLTAVLVEISELDLMGQSALQEIVMLRCDEEREEKLPRLVFLSSHNLDHDVRLGKFREDLYYRISGVCLRIPPLRHRREDIPGLIDWFLTKYSVLLGRPKVALSEAGLQSLAEYAWPGNVRELEDAARTIAAIGDEHVAMIALKSGQRSIRPRSLKAQRASLKEVSRAASRAAEKELILKVLSRTQWNRKRAAEELRISYKALLYKMKQIGMNGPHSVAEGEL
jgi:two-component system response regulator AtoC